MGSHKEHNCEELDSSHRRRPPNVGLWVFLAFCAMLVVLIAIITLKGSP